MTIYILIILGNSVVYIEKKKRIIFVYINNYFMIILIKSIEYV